MAESASLNDTTQHLARALHSLFHGESPEERRAADKWLQRLQRESAGWNVADSILQGTALPADASLDDPATQEALFFGAQTLHIKICYDFQELTPEMVTALRGMVQQYIERWGLQPGKTVPRNILKKLASAVAVFALQTNWQDVLSYVESLMGRATGDSLGLVCRVVLELMQALPEQRRRRRIAVSPERRDEFHSYLCSVAGRCLGMLEQIARAAPPTMAEVHKQVLVTLQGWISNCNINPEALATHALFLSTFDALANDATFEHAVDVLVEVLRCYDSAQANMPIVRVMVPRVMALKPRFVAARDEEDDDTAKGLCRLFTEMGEAYMSLITSEQDFNQMAVVELVLTCAAHTNLEIATIPANFWYRLVKEWLRLPQDDHRERLRASLHPFCAQLVLICVRLLRYPKDAPTADDDDLIAHRHEISDTLTDCCQILGGPACLMQIYGELQREVAATSAAGTAAEWQGVEACLHAVQAIAPQVRDAEAVPQILQLVVTLPAWPRVIPTTNLTIGRYAPWLQDHPDFIQPLFSFLLQHVGTASSASATASRSIKRICEHCARHMGEPVLSLYDHLLSWKNKLDLKDELEIIEGLCHVISSLEHAALVQASNRIVQPVAQQLATYASAPEENVKLVVAELERLTTIVRYIHPHQLTNGHTHPVLDVMQQVWPVLEAIAERFRSNPNLMEKLCRCYKHAMRSCNVHFAPMLPKMIAHLVQSFSKAPHCSFLYAGSICITEFGNVREYVPVLFDMIQNFSGIVFQNLQSIEQFTANPDMVEEYFYLVARFISYCPDPLLQSPMLASVLQCGVIGLRLEHREAHQGVLHCFEKVISAGDPTPDGWTPQLAEQRELVRQVISQPLVGKPIVEGILRSLTGELPAYAVDESHGSLTGVLWRLNALCPEQLHAWCGAVLPSLPAPIASAQEKAEFLRLISNSVTQDAFSDAVLGFSSRCRDRAKTMR